MEIGILILIILGSFIFKKGKSSEESPQKPVPSKDMTWEEMEEYYGITLSRDSEESVKVIPDVMVGNTSEGADNTSNSVGVDTYKEPVDSARYTTEEMYAEVHGRTEDTRQTFVSSSVEEVRKEGTVYPSTSRKESLRLAARHGMVWSMILETPKGVRMLRRHNR